MLRLHGFSASNYYNAAKLALLEKNLAFEEVTVYTGAGPSYRPDYLDMSPLGKVPCLQTEQGFISESRCIIDYLEDAHPESPLYPEPPFERAKLRELTQVIDLYLELAARRLLPQALMGTDAPEPLKLEVRAVVDKGVIALQKLAHFDAHLLGEPFTAADISAEMHFPIVTLICKAIFGDDPLAKVPGLPGYRERLEERPCVQRVRKDSQANMPDFFAHLKAHYG